MSQVKNLRAMFENKEDTSPPDRGRSSGVSTPNHAGPYGTGSPRPLSKVRTSFVTVEKDGRMGLRRDPSGESSVSRRRLSNDTDVESISTIPDKSAMISSDEGSRPARKLFVNEPIPESPRNPPDTTDVFGGNPKESTNAEPAAVKSSDDKQPGPDSKTATSTATSAAQEPRASTEIIAASSSEATKPTLADRPKVSATTKKPVSRPSNLTVRPGVAKTNEASKSPKAAKPPSEAPKKLDAKPSSKEATKSLAKQNTTSSSKPLSSAGGRPSAMANKKPQILKTKASHDAGFTKPKPKSPTKPVSLPSSLTAPTASSVSKGNAPRQSLSRQSGTLQNTASNGRSLSRASASTTGAPAKTVRRQPSTISRSRPSLGPPPKKAPPTEPSTKKVQSQVDEGFLARMMRPTQASSSKVAEKAPVTPPRRSTQGASTSGTASNAKYETKNKAGEASASPRAKRVQRNVQAQPSSVPGKPFEDTQGVVVVSGGATSRAEADEPTQAEHLPAMEVEKNAETLGKAGIDAITIETATAETVEEVIELAHRADQSELPGGAEIVEQTSQGSAADVPAGPETTETGTIQEVAQPPIGMDESQIHSTSTEADDKHSLDEQVAVEDVSHGEPVEGLEKESLLELGQQAANIEAENPSSSKQ